MTLGIMRCYIMSNDFVQNNLQNCLEKIIIYDNVHTDSFYGGKRYGRTEKRNKVLHKLLGKLEKIEKRYFTSWTWLTY